MARPVLTSDGDQAHVAEATRRNTKALIFGLFAGKKFQDLKPNERDDLLKAVAIKLGLIEE
jgi:hypothetical protein